MKVFNQHGTKEKLFEMMNRVNKMTLNETFDVPSKKDEKYLDKAVSKGGEQQSNKYDHGYEYPVNDDIKTKHNSLDKVVNEAGGDESFWEYLKQTFRGPETSLSKRRKEEMGGPSGVAGAELSKLKHQQVNKDLNKGQNEAKEVENGEEEILKGGLADGMEPHQFDPQAILKGMEKEMKHHTDNPQAALEITMDNLVADPEYYNKEEEEEENGEEEVDVEDDEDKEIYEQIKRNKKLSHL